jgi:hypothetical protein
LGQFGILNLLECINAEAFVPDDHLVHEQISLHGSFDSSASDLPIKW